MKKIPYLIAFALGILLAGCTRHYVPSIHTVNPALVPNLKGDQAVCVINISTATGETILGTNDLGTKAYMGDLSKWTDTAVALLKLELEKRGFIIRERKEDSKVIKLAIRLAQIAVPMGTYCFVELHLETGDGYSRNYIANSSSFSYRKALDEVVTSVIISVLNDKKIIEYLQAATGKETS